MEARRLTNVDRKEVRLSSITLSSDRMSRDKNCVDDSLEPAKEGNGVSRTGCRGGEELTVVSQRCQAAARVVAVKEQLSQQHTCEFLLCIISVYSLLPQVCFVHCLYKVILVCPGYI